MSEHPYLYCEHEPIMRVDPSGMFDITGWLGRTLQLDFNFTKDDWKQIADGIDKIADFEIAAGLAIAGISDRLDKYWPKPPPRKQLPPRRGRPRPPKTGIPTPPEIGGAVGGGLFIGGLAAKGIAWLIREWAN